MIFMAIFGCDHDEKIETSLDLEKIMYEIQDFFRTRHDPRDAGFAMEIYGKKYSRKEWVVFDLFAIDPTTAASVGIEIKRASRALRSNHERLAFTHATQADLDQKAQERQESA